MNKEITKIIIMKISKKIAELQEERDTIKRIIQNLGGTFAEWNQSTNYELEVMKIDASINTSCEILDMILDVCIDSMFTDCEEEK